MIYWYLNIKPLEYFNKKKIQRIYHNEVNFDCQYCANASIVGENDTKSYPRPRVGMTDKIDGISKDGWDMRVDECRPIQIKLRYHCRTAFWKFIAIDFTSTLKHRWKFF